MSLKKRLLRMKLTLFVVVFFFMRICHTSIQEIFG